MMQGLYGSNRFVRHRRSEGNNTFAQQKLFHDRLGGSPKSSNQNHGWPTTFEIVRRNRLERASEFRKPGICISRNSLSNPNLISQLEKTSDSISLLNPSKDISFDSKIKKKKKAFSNAKFYRLSKKIEKLPSILLKSNSNYFGCVGSSSPIGNLFGKSQFANKKCDDYEFEPYIRHNRAKDSECMTDIHSREFPDIKINDNQTLTPKQMKKKCSLKSQSRIRIRSKLIDFSEREQLSPWESRGVNTDIII
ncbi:unnamed protein product [Blepharisma stoltei]|uniref:Uncharacterized protein n=1 Tax=Blepharisma stoltei TaxID=1481888 RepID=A0AAU9JTI3_9CILI|nr:unnamed protein product [Blepharisma stoltei]